jgi:serine/threonine-protein kinase
LHLRELVMKKAAAATMFAALVWAGASGAQAQNYFGSIAYDANTRNHGYSFDYGSQQAAEQAALAECRKRSGGCTVAIWFRNACGALAIGNAGWGAHWGNDQAQAEGRALQKCYEFTTGCKIERWVCTKR